MDKEETQITSENEGQWSGTERCPDGNKGSKQYKERTEEAHTWENEVQLIVIKNESSNATSLRWPCGIVISATYSKHQED